MKSFGNESKIEQKKNTLSVSVSRRNFYKIYLKEISIRLKIFMKFTSQESKEK